MIHTLSDTATISKECILAPIVKVSKDFLFSHPLTNYTSNDYVATPIKAKLNCKAGLEKRGRFPGRKMIRPTWFLAWLEKTGKQQFKRNLVLKSGYSYLDSAIGLFWSGWGSSPSRNWRVFFKKTASELRKYKVMLFCLTRAL